MKPTTDQLRQWGKLGGVARSLLKIKASRANGKLGGRPKYSEIECERSAFGLRWYVKLRIINNHGQVSFLRCHITGFKTKADAIQYARVVSEQMRQLEKPILPTIGN